MAQTSDKVTQPAGVTAEKRVADRPAWMRMLSSNWLLCLLVFGVALGFDLYRLGSPSIWFDEAFSVELARQPLPLLWHIMWGPEPNMELYYLFLHAWLAVTGWLGLLPTEVVVRLPSAIFAALSAVIVFLLGRRLLGLTAGIVGTGLYILNYVQLTYAQQTRAYSLQLLLLCLAWYALFAALSSETRQRRWWACFILASVLAIYAHLFSVLILISQVIAFGGLLLLPGPWRMAARQRLRAFLLSLVVIGVLSIPMFLVSLHGAKTGWLPVPHLSDITHLFLFITTNSKVYLLLLFAVCAFALAIALMAYLPDFALLVEPLTFRAGDEQGRARLHSYLSLAFALLCWLVVPVMLSYIISQGSTRLFSTRYLVVILPALFLLAGLGVGALRWPAIRAALTLALLLVALYYVPVYYRSAQVEDWNTAVPWLQQYYQPGDGLVCFDNDVQQGCQISVEYYLHAYPGAAHFTGDAPGEFSWQNFGPANPRSGPQSALDPRALAAYAAQHPRIFFITGRIPDDAAGKQAQQTQQWLDSHYHLLGRIHTPTVTISLYATSG